MKRILLFLLVFPLFLSYPNPTLAAGACAINTDTFPVDTNETAVTLTIKYQPRFATGNKYWVRLGERYIMEWYSIGPVKLLRAKEFDHTGDTITVPEVDATSYLINADYPLGKAFEAKNYTVVVTTIGGILPGDTICSGSFDVQQAASGATGSCTGIEFINSDFRPSDNVRFKIEPIPQIGKRRIVVKRGGQYGSDMRNKEACVDTSSLTDPGGYDLKTFDVGNYLLEVQGEGALNLGGCGITSKTLCFTNFTICADCKSPGKGQGGKPEVPSPVKCEGDSACLACVEDEKNPKGIPTPIGCIKTNPAGLVSFILKFLLYISGGIAALLIIFGGYTMMTSQGNPEKLQGARETITSAVVGLLFIIFSLVLLEIIGVDILRIPGFGK